MSNIGFIGENWHETINMHGYAVARFCTEVAAYALLAAVANDDLYSKSGWISTESEGIDPNLSRAAFTRTIDTSHPLLAPIVEGYEMVESQLRASLGQNVFCIDSVAIRPEMPFFSYMCGYQPGGGREPHMDRQAGPSYVASVFLDRRHVLGLYNSSDDEEPDRAIKGLVPGEGVVLIHPGLISVRGMIDPACRFKLHSVPANTHSSVVHSLVFSRSKFGNTGGNN